MALEERDHLARLIELHGAPRGVKGVGCPDQVIEGLPAVSLQERVEVAQQLEAQPVYKTVTAAIRQGPPADQSLPQGGGIELSGDKEARDLVFGVEGQLPLQGSFSLLQQLVRLAVVRVQLCCLAEQTDCGAGVARIQLSSGVGAHLRHLRGNPRTSNLPEQSCSCCTGGVALQEGLEVGLGVVGREAGDLLLQLSFGCDKGLLLRGIYRGGKTRGLLLQIGITTSMLIYATEETTSGLKVAGLQGGLHEDPEGLDRASGGSGLQVAKGNILRGTARGSDSQQTGHRGQGSHPRGHLLSQLEGINISGEVIDQQLQQGHRRVSRAAGLPRMPEQPLRFLVVVGVEGRTALIEKDGCRSGRGGWGGRGSGTSGWSFGRKRR